MNYGKRVLLIGGGGFLGTALALELANSDSVNEVIIVGRTSKLCLEAIAPHAKISSCAMNIDEDTSFEGLLNCNDVVVHLLSSTIPASPVNDAINGFKDIAITARLLQACVNSQIDKVLFVSSGGAIYGNNEGTPSSENDSCKPLSFYGFQKDAIERLCDFYYRKYGLEYVAARLSNPYGPGQISTKVQGVVPIFARAILRGEPLKIRGDGSAERDYVYITDAVKAISLLIFNNTKDHIYNIGSGHSISLNDLIKMLEDACGKQANVLYMASSSQDVGAVRLDVARFENEFNKISLISLQDGLRKTIASIIRELFICDNKNSSI